MRLKTGFLISTVAIVLLSSNYAAAADGPGVELAVFGGPALPTYKQSLTLNGEGPQFQFARLTPKTEASIDAEGGLSLGGAATLFLSDTFGFEARVDSIDVDLKSFAGTYVLEIGTTSSSLTSTAVSLGTGETKLDSVRPWSLNLRYQSQHRVGFGFSFGVSYLRSLSAAASPTLSVANVSATLPVSLTAAPSDGEGQHHWGANGGVTVQIKIAGGFSVSGEARGFAFRKSDLQWQESQTGSLSAIEQSLLQSLTAKLETPTFTPGFWTARVGVALRF